MGPLAGPDQVSWTEAGESSTAASLAAARTGLGVVVGPLLPCPLPFGSAMTSPATAPATATTAIAVPIAPRRRLRAGGLVPPSFFAVSDGTAGPGRAAAGAGDTGVADAGVAGRVCACPVSCSDSGADGGVGVAVTMCVRPGSGSKPGTKPAWPGMYGRAPTISASSSYAVGRCAGSRG